MRNSKYLDVVSTRNPMVAAIINRESGMVLAEYSLSYNASYMQNAELAAQLLQAFENYYGIQQKEPKP
jgi:hypothetical protein